MKDRVILGITAFNHDSSACIICNGKVVAFCEEERFNGVKHTNAFPTKSIDYCLASAKLKMEDITDVAYYFNPVKCVISYLKHNNPLFFFSDATVFFRKRFYFELVWLADFINKIVTIRRHVNRTAKIHYIDHHVAHTWYGYYSSGFKDCVVLSNDSVGEDISTLAVKFSKTEKSIETSTLIKQYDPQSLGYLYGAVTEYLGFKRGEGEGRVMALASFGNRALVDNFLSEVRLLPKGCFSFSRNLLLNRNFQSGGHRLGVKIRELIGNKRRSSDELTQNHYNVSRAVQEVYEKISFHQLNYLVDYADKLVLTGGVAQNSVFNGKASNAYQNKEFFIPPITNDAGCSLGAAVYLCYQLEGYLPALTETSLLGPEYNDEEIVAILKNNLISYEFLDNPVEFCVKMLGQSKVIGVFRGKMECGPRALCNRSILANPADPEMRNYLNHHVKYREPFRPYGGFMKADDVKELLIHKSIYEKGPYMTYVYDVKPEWYDRIPSLVHIDKTCRVQLIDQNGDKFLLDLLKRFKEVTKIPIIINTSMNLRGYPIARAPSDALSTFYTSGMDFLLFNNRILIKK
jgi:carbamoyltransferase